MFAQVRLALLAAEQISPGLEEAVVLSAEANPSRLSKFAGFVFETLSLAADAPQAGLPWRSAVLRYLQGLGLPESDLSAAALPSREDVRRVSRFCTSYRANHRASLKRQPVYGDRLSLQWKLGNYGELTLRWREDGALQVPTRDLLRFFEARGRATPAWVAALPPAHKRYRLSPGGQLPPHPYYQDVLLADIPSFKGLESAAIVFVVYNEFARDHDDLMATLYVAFSRARCGLMIVTPHAA
jgi:hypothetical protein